VVFFWNKKRCPVCSDLDAYGRIHAGLITEKMEFENDLQKLAEKIVYLEEEKRSLENEAWNLKQETNQLKIDLQGVEMRLAQKEKNG
jgi:SMC interacting uncharacterized protein involved in chromosome segregation